MAVARRSDAVACFLIWMSCACVMARWRSAGLVASCGDAALPKPARRAHDKIAGASHADRSRDLSEQAAAARSQTRPMAAPNLAAMRQAIRSRKLAEIDRLALSTVPFTHRARLLGVTFSTKPG